MRLYVLFLAAVATLALAQQDKGGKDATAQTSEQNKDKEKGKQKGGLFQNRLGYQSSQTTKESTTLGFNGIDPSGKVDREMLAKTPTTADQEKVKLMAQNRPQPNDLRAFLQQGGLKEK